MPTRSATRRIDSAPSPSASSSARAASTISRARGASPSGTDEPVARAEVVADRAVEVNVEGPREGADQEPGTEQTRERGRGEQRRAGEAVECVVQRDGARVQLPALET